MGTHKAAIAAKNKEKKFQGNTVEEKKLNEEKVDEKKKETNCNNVSQDRYSGDHWLYFDMF